MAASKFVCLNGTSQCYSEKKNLNVDHVKKICL